MAFVDQTVSSSKKRVSGRREKRGIAYRRTCVSYTLYFTAVDSEGKGIQELENPQFHALAFIIIIVN